MSLSVSQLGDERSTAVELLRVDDESVLEKDAIITSKDHALTAALTQRFVNLVAQRLVVAKAPPAEVVLTPTPTLKAQPAVITTPPPPPPRSHAVSIGLSAGGLAALGVGVGLLVSGVTASAEATRSDLVNGRAVSTLTASAAQQKVDAANVQLGIAAGCAVAAAGLGTAAVLTW